MKNLSLKILLLALAVMGPRLSEAKLLQILHTNDTHAYLDNSTHSTTRGGAARLKALINQYKNKMADEGVKTLVVDAGDFLEGNLYYMAENGRKAFQVHNEMGYDIATLGNHDYQMGSAELDKILGEIDLNFSLLVANIDTNNKYKNLKSKIKPYQEIEFEGMKIGIFGLTTDEIFYRWRLARGAIIDPIDSGKEQEEILRNRGNDFIIALTHIGVLRDIKLAEKTRYIDLIVGGHSHTALYEPVYGVNKLKKRVPIVQAGMHTEYLGRLVVDLVKGKPLKIVSYELVPVIVEDSMVDQDMQQRVKEADIELEASYGKDWLEEKIGYSDLVANDEKGARKWAYFITDALKEKSGADIAIHSPEMNGSNYPVGDITRKVILNSIPRVFEFEQKYGWDIYTTKVRGTWLRVTIEALSHFNQPLTFSGIKIEYDRGPLGLKIKKITVDGKTVNPFKLYTVAFTEGIIRGAKGIDPRTIAILRHPVNTNYKIWATLEEKVRESKHPISKICEDSHTFMWPDR